MRSTEDAARVIDAGARFVVSPGTDPELFAFCCEKEVLVMPGVCTPSEILAALRAGAACSSSSRPRPPEASRS